MYQQNNPVVNPIEANAFQGNSTPLAKMEGPGDRFGQLLPAFITYARYEQSLSAQTAEKYQESLGWVVRHLGDISVKLQRWPRIIEYPKTVDSVGRLQFVATKN